MRPGRVGWLLAGHVYFILQTETYYSLQTKMQILELYETDTQQLESTLTKRQLNRTMFHLVKK